MPLIKCPECGRSVSSLIDYCPFCGYPIDSELRADLIKKNLTKQACILSVNKEIIIYHFLFILVFNHCDIKSDKEIIIYFDYLKSQGFKFVRYYSGLEVSEVNNVINDRDELNESNSLNVEMMSKCIVLPYKHQSSYSASEKKIFDTFNLWKYIDDSYLNERETEDYGDEDDYSEINEEYDDSENVDDEDETYDYTDEQLKALDDIKALLNDSNKLNEKAEELIKQINLLCNENNELGSKCEQLESIGNELIDKCSKRFEWLKKERSNLSLEECQKQLAEINSLNARIKEIVNQIETYKTQYSQNETQINKLTNEVNYFYSKIEDNLTKINTIKEENGLEFDSDDESDFDEEDSSCNDYELEETNVEPFEPKSECQPDDDYNEPCDDQNYVSEDYEEPYEDAMDHLEEEYHNHDAIEEYDGKGSVPSLYIQVEEDEYEDVSLDYGYLEDEPELLKENLKKLYGN